MIPVRDPSVQSDLSIPKKLFQMDSHQACVNCVRWSYCGKWLASGGMDKVIMIWSKTASTSRPTTVFGSKEQTKFTENWRCICVLRGHSGDIIDLAWSHDGNRLASASVDNSVIIWARQRHNTPTTQFALLTSLKAHSSIVKGVAWDPVGRFLASQGDDGMVKVWRTADWQVETNVSKPFAKVSGQSQVMRLSWSLDGSTIAVPHAINNDFPTAKLIDRTNWTPNLDLVGHRKHTICANYSPVILRKGRGDTAHNLVCLALGSKDRSVSVWTSDSQRPRIVINDLFTNSVCDLTCLFSSYLYFTSLPFSTRSSNGQELLACSLDGTVSFMSFSSLELGSPWSTSDVIQFHHKLYGQSLLDKTVSSSSLTQSGQNELPSATVKQTTRAINGGGSLDESVDILLETPDAVELQRKQAEVRLLLTGAEMEATANAAANNRHNGPRGPTEQIEARGKDGRRRITPKFLGHLDGPDEDTTSNPHFSPENSKSSLPAVEPSKKLNSISPNNTSTPVKIGDGVEASKILPSVALERLQSPEASAPKLQNGTSNSSPTKETVPPSSVDKGHVIAPFTNDTSAKQLNGIEPMQIDDDNHDGQSQLPTGVDRVPELPPSSTSTTTKPANNTESVKPVKHPRPSKKRRLTTRMFPDDEDGQKKEILSVAAARQDEDALPLSPSSRKQGRLEPTGDLAARKTASESVSSCLLPFATRRLITTPDQLTGQSKVNFVCSDATNRPILVELTPGGNQLDATALTCIAACRGERRLWRVDSRHRLTACAHNNSLIAVGDTEGRLQLLHSQGGRLCPPLRLDSAVHSLHLLSNSSTSNQQPLSTLSQGKNGLIGRLHCVVSGKETNTALHSTPPSSSSSSCPQLLVLCQSGRLSCYQIGASLPSSTLPRLVWQTHVDSVARRDTPGSEFASFKVLLQDLPIVYLRNGSSFLYQSDSDMWLELFDASDPIVTQTALKLARSGPPGPLASLQALAKNADVRHLTSSTSSRLPPRSGDPQTTDQRLKVQNFLEWQTENAKMFGSSVEYKYWMTRWFRHLVEDNEEERLRQLSYDLIGPISHGSKTSWEPAIKNLKKHELMKELLTLFALNLRLQRLYVDLKEMLSLTQEADSSQLSQ